ncbi:MAG TPA: hypothetical protein VMG30_06670 [Acidobacteriota bacterium]|nr:hypothetical protein [Acidobacteriota bacterium]
MSTVPFLYLPDAVTMILLLVVLGALRRLAIDHIRLEILILREELLLYWANCDLDFDDRGCRALRNLMESSIGLVPGLSPGRLLFVYRLQRITPRKKTVLSFPDPSFEVSSLIERTANAKAREKLKRLQLEMNMALGIFFLMGSLSGLFLFFLVLSKMLGRTISHYQKNRTDVFFDMLERVLVRFGRQAQQIGYAGCNPALGPQEPAVPVSG